MLSSPQYFVNKPTYDNVMRMLAYGVAADAVDEYIKIGSGTTLECLLGFCKGYYMLVYLRVPTQDDLQRILHVSEMRGFP